MGGNIFTTNYEVARLDTSQYLKLQSLIRDKLHAKRIQIYQIPYLRDKSSFGDLDLIVDSKDTDKLLNWFLKDLIYPYSTNGNVSSVYYYPFKFQIDFIRIDTLDIDYAVNYFAWGCAGNLVGRLAKKLGIKHGHKGLYYVQRNNDHVIEEILLSRKYIDILNILQLDSQKFFQGFDSEIDMFQWFTSSPYFNIEYFLFENLPNKDRVRDRKRKDYNTFIKWCLTQSFKSPLTIGNKQDFVVNYFPELLDKINKNLEILRINNLVKSKINGNIVMELTGLRNKELNDFLIYFKNKYNTNCIISTPSEYIKIYILGEYFNIKNGK